jgi:hypothetical protein
MTVLKTRLDIVSVLALGIFVAYLLVPLFA